MVSDGVVSDGVVRGGSVVVVDGDVVRMTVFFVVLVLNKRQGRKKIT